MWPLSIGQILLASIVLGLLGLYTAVLKIDQETQTNMYISPTSQAITLTENLTVDIVVESEVPVNAFTGKLLYDPEIFAVESISYNTSIADLWVEEPWFSEGDGTITFSGGTTQAGGFLGTGSLLTITFTPQKESASRLILRDAHIYAHDGFGSEVALTEPVDALFTITALKEQVRTEVAVTTPELWVYIKPDHVSFDLNQDGKVNLADVSIFMLNIFGNNPRFDFNGDLLVDGQDLKLLLQARN